jgi:hypothetical protein
MFVRIGLFNDSFSATQIIWRRIAGLLRMSWEGSGRGLF